MLRDDDTAGEYGVCMQVEVKIRGLMVDPSSGTPIVVLKDVNSDTLLPIWVGTSEANAIALEIEKTAPQRPMTHDLVRNIIVGMGAYVHKVVISELRDNTFYALIEISRSVGESVFLDARPSDAIALALRSDCPIFVEEDVMRASRNSVIRKDDEEASELDEAEDWPDIIGEAGDLPM